MLSAKFRRNTPCGSREKVDLIGFANLLTAASLNSQSGCFFFFFFFFFIFHSEALSLMLPVKFTIYAVLT